MAKKYLRPCRCRWNRSRNRGSRPVVRCRIIFPARQRRIVRTQAVAPGCGGTLREFGEDVSEVLEYVPESFKVVRHVRPKFSCGRCETVIEAPAPSRPIPRCYTGPGLLAHVLVAKYCDHTPLNRQSEIYARDGVDLDRSTLAGWVGASAALHFVAAVAVADEGSLSKAAIRLNITQSAVSKQILALEGYLGHQLLKRNNRRLHTTAAGNVFVRHARLPLKIQERATQLSREAFAHSKTVLHLGKSPYADAFFISALTAVQQSEFPEVDLRRKQLLCRTKQASHRWDLGYGGPYRRSLKPSSLSSKARVQSFLCPCSRR